MLTIKDLRWNFLLFHFMAKLNIFIAVFDKRTGIMTHQVSRTRRILYHLWAYWCKCHAAYINFQAITSILGGSGDAHLSQLHRLPMLVLFSVSFPVTCHGSSVMFNTLDLNFKIFNGMSETLRAQTQEREMTRKEDVMTNIRNVQRIKRWLKEKKPIELLIILMPFVMMPIFCMYPILYIVDPEIKILLRNLISMFGWSPWSWHQFPVVSTSLSLLFEYSSSICYVGFCNYACVYQLLFFTLFKGKVQKEIDRVKSMAGAAKNDGPQNAHTLIKVVEALRAFHLELLLFNLAFSKIVFNSKFLCLSCGITGGYAAIRLAHTNIPIAIVGSIAFSTCIIAFIGMYNTAFEVSDLMDVLKAEILLETGRTTALRKRRKRFDA